MSKRARGVSIPGPRALETVSFERITPPSARQLYGLHVRGPPDVVAADDLGALLRFDGARWTARDSPAQRLQRVISLDDGSLVASDVGVIVGSTP